MRQVPPPSCCSAASPDSSSIADIVLGAPWTGLSRETQEVFKRLLLAAAPASLRLLQQPRPSWHDTCGGREYTRAEEYTHKVKLAEELGWKTKNTKTKSRMWGCPDPMAVSQ